MRDLFALLSEFDTIPAGLFGCNTLTPAISVARFPNAVVVVSAVRCTPFKARLKNRPGFILDAIPVLDPVSWRVSCRSIFVELR